MRRMYIFPFINGAVSAGVIAYLWSMYGVKMKIWVSVVSFIGIGLCIGLMSIGGISIWRMLKKEGHRPG